MDTRRVQRQLGGLEDLLPLRVITWPRSAAWFPAWFPASRVAARGTVDYPKVDGK